VVDKSYSSDRWAEVGDVSYDRVLAFGAVELQVMLRKSSLHSVDNLWKKQVVTLSVDLTME